MTLATAAASCAGADAADGPKGRDSSALGGAEADILYVSDYSASGNNSVDRFSGATGDSLGPLVPTGSNGLLGPTGLIFRPTNAHQPGDLLLNNQLAVSGGGPGGGSNGEIMKFASATPGAFRGLLVEPTDPHAPFNPQGIVVGRDGIVYVTDQGSMGFPVADNNNLPRPGRVARYDSSGGNWLGDLSLGSYTGEFHPRALVFGPDGKLYVSSVDANPNNIVTGIAAAGGAVLRFNTATGRFQDVFIDGDQCIEGDPSSCTENLLNRPQGLVFDRRGTRLYVTSFRRDTSRRDKILVFDGHTGAFRPDDTLALVAINQDPTQTPPDRAFAQAMLFGPEGKLFVPISGGPDQGSIRRYDVKTKDFDVLVAAGGALGQPSFLTFRKTNPATLAYDDHEDDEEDPHP
jgi:DNA-binding beta-propeller fold protein YncE